MLKNLSWSLFERIVRLITSAVIGIWLAKYLGPEQYGTFNYAISFVSIASIFTTLGLQSVVVKNIVLSPAEINEIISASFLIIFFSSVISFVFLILSVSLVEPRNSTMIYLVTVMGISFFMQPFQVLIFKYEAESRFELISKINLTVVACSALAKVIAVMYDEPLHNLAMVMVFESLLVSFILCLIYYNGNNKVVFSIKIPTLKKFIASSVPLTFVGVSVIVQSRVDQVMLGKLVGEYELGLYSISLRFVEVIAMVAMVVKAVFNPFVLRKRNENFLSFSRELADLYGVFFLLATASILFIYLFREPIVLLSVGPEYLAAVPILAVMSFRIIFTYFGAARSIFITSENLFWWSALTVVIGTSINIIFNFLFIPTFGATGAAFTSLLSFFVSLIFLDLFNSQTRKNLLIMISGLAFVGSGAFYARVLKKLRN